MSSRGITLEKRGAVAWIMLDAPPGDDVTGADLAAALREACGEASQDDEVRVLVLTGAEGNSWLPASAMGAPPDQADGLGGDRRLDELRLAATVAAVEKPVIAVLGGSVMGRGLELALACDLRLASEEARFGMPQGSLPWDGGTQRLPRVVGQARALELLLTGREVDAQEALEMGLVHRTVPAHRLREAARELAERVAGCAPIALRYAKEAVRSGMDAGLEAGLRLEADLNIILQSTEDRAEGIRSFLERRTPRFQGR